MARRSATTLVVMIAALGSLSVGVGRASDSQPRSASAECNPPPPPPMPPASEFVAQVDNQYFPLEPGTTFLYRGREQSEPVQDKVVVTDMTKTILGVEATVVDDFVAVRGLPSEKTSDWYAQDKHGNVWYMGEDAFEFVHGRWIRSDDSWEAGRDGGVAGIIMEAHPKVGDTYRQEYYAGHAEDMATVLDTHASVSVPYGTFRHALKTSECTPLEPGVLDIKYHARGVGEVFEATVRGGSAKLALVSVTHA